MRGTFRRISLDDPETLERFVRKGLIWDYAVWWQLGVNAIESGLVPLDECKDVPPKIREFLTAPRTR